MKRVIEVKPGKEFFIYIPKPLVPGDVQAYEILWNTGSDLTGSIFTVTAIRGDGETVTGQGITEGYTARYTLANNMYSVPGEVKLRLTVTSPAGNVLTDCELHFDVLDGVEDQDLSGEDRVPVLNQLIMDAASAGEYARTQGDYAKEQGDYVNEQIENFALPAPSFSDRGKVLTAGDKGEYTPNTGFLFVNIGSTNTTYRLVANYQGTGLEITENSLAGCRLTADLSLQDGGDFPVDTLILSNEMRDSYQTVLVIQKPEGKPPTLQGDSFSNLTVYTPAYQAAPVWKEPLRLINSTDTASPGEGALDAYQGALLKQQIDEKSGKCAGTYIVNTQEDWNTLVADNTWLGARHVVICTDIALSGKVVIPPTVVGLEAVGGAKITYETHDKGDGFSFGYETFSQNTYMRGVVLDIQLTEPVEEAANANYGFYRCANLLNCRCTIDFSAGSWDSEAYAFHECQKLTNCFGIARGKGAGYSSVFKSCAYLSGCTAVLDGYTAASAYGFEKCNYLSGCAASDQRPSDIATFYYVYYFIGCKYLSACTVTTDKGLADDKGFSGCSNVSSSGLIYTGTESYAGTLWNKCTKVDTDSCDDEPEKA